MKRNKLDLFLAIATLAMLLCTGILLPALAQEAKITVDVNKPGVAVSPMLWGIFFEDINCSADGGIYPELVRNRSFEDSDKPEHWLLATDGSAKAELSIDRRRPFNPLNRSSLCLRISSATEGKIRLINQGYWGMSVIKGAGYRLSLAARCGDGFKGPLTVTLESKSGQPLAQGTIDKLGTNWNTFTLELQASDTDPQAQLVIAATQQGTVWLDMVSLLPKTTWKNHGLRPDLAAMLEGLKPAFVRFPGGCWVEGEELKTSYHWKTTIGDVAHRLPLYNLWQYQATHGLGFHEYLQMCEDLGAEPLFVINCGMSHRENVPMDQMGSWVQDALDAIEYANGPTNTVWGGLRANNGHAAPFNLRCMEIGNENGGPAYQERYALFFDAIKDRFPQMILVADQPTDRRPADIVDEHYYSSPEFFMQQAGRYDTYDRKGPKIYVGEYAVTQGCGQGNLRGAIGEAAFMTGMERNSDILVMSSYAPLFVNVNYRKWNPNLIDFDSSRAFGIPSYYVQQMFSEHRGDVVLPVALECPLVQEAPKGGAVGVGTWATQAEFKDLKVTRGDQTLFASDFQKDTQGWKLLGGDWKVENGVLRQNALADNVRAIVGDKTWTNYTYSLKARKLGGAEGFLILFRVGDENEKSWWNIGGWGNDHHALEMGGVVGNEVRGRIETGRWYDIRIELKESGIQCYLDGKLLHDAQYPSVRALYASATLARGPEEVILKVVNTSSAAQPAEIKLNGISRINGPAKTIVLTSEKPTDENSLANPTKVAPVIKTEEVNGTGFRHVFPGNSVTVFRLKAGR